MRVSGLHFCRWNTPSRAIKVKFRPFGMPKIAGANKYKWGKFECGSNNCRAFKDIKHLQHFTNAFRVFNCCKILLAHRRKSALQIWSRVAFRSSGCYGISENLACTLLDSVSGLKRVCRILCNRDFGYCRGSLSA